MLVQGKILIVEDEDHLRITLRDYLKVKNFDVIVASDGVGAIKQLLDNKVEVVLTDYKMDILGGNYWIKFLNKYCNDIQIFITTGFLESDINSPFQVIYKPYDYSEIERLLSECLSK